MLNETSQLLSDSAEKIFSDHVSKECIVNSEKGVWPKELWNELHLQIIWYGREYSPARGWDLDKDIITKTIGRRSVLKAYQQSKK